ncbi:MAG: hypothetical protein KAT15_22885 [Bacteroidales bacterium]|nr:hypothetical protein [Bacteroidales bacterium]
MSNRTRHTLDPVLTGLILGLILLNGCREESTNPFQVDTYSGTFTFRGGVHQMGPAHMDVNGSDPLRGAFLFREKESLVYINSAGDLDIIALFAGDPTEGMLQIQLINAGEENLEIFRIDPFILPLEQDDQMLVINGNEARLISTQDKTIHFILSVMEETPWDLRFIETGESLILSLLFNGSSIVLLPEEILKLPAMSIITGSSHHPY